MNAGIIKAEYPMRPEFPIQVASIQTIASRRRTMLELWPRIDLIVIDEGHHIQEDNTYGALLQMYPDAKVLIVTATPYRLSGKGFANIYPGKEVRLIINQTNKQLIDDGYLVPFEYHIGFVPDLSGVKIEKGEYNEEQLEAVMGLAPIVESYKEHFNGKSGICFAITVKHSETICEQYNAAGIPAVHVDANTDPEVRTEYFKQFRAKKIKIVVNVGILTEGTDFPICEFVQLAAPTRSLSKFFQMVGRVTRILPGVIDNLNDKDDRLAAIVASDKPFGGVLDNSGCWIDHGFPDDDIEWARYFEGWQKVKKPKETEDMMELLLFEVVDPATGEQKTVKTVKECEGMIMIKVTKEKREGLKQLRHIKKFDEIYQDAIINPHNSKPGYHSYYKFRKYCVTGNVAITEAIWKHLKQRLVTDVDLMMGAYCESEQAAGRTVIPAINRRIADIRAKGVAGGFLGKEKSVYIQSQQSIINSQKNG